MYFFNNFIIYSTLGFIMESTVYKFMDSSRHSGILYGPYAFVYGFGIITIIIINSFFEKLKINKILKLIIMFFSFVILLTLVEWVSGHILHFIFKIDLWDYTKHKYNIGKYISIPISISWGILGLIFVYILKPISDKLIKIIKPSFTYTILFLMLIDNICTLIFKS